MWNCVCGKYIYVFGIVGRPRQVSTPEPCGGSGPCTTNNPFYSTCTCGSPSIYSNDNLLNKVTLPQQIGSFWDSKNWTRNRPPLGIQVFSKCKMGQDK